jgi:glycine/D-amino acid oxidase-like deaminating enzyme
LAASDSLMRRRDFLLTSSALAAGAAGLFVGQQRIIASVEYPGRDQGHWLRDAKQLPEPAQSIETEVLIAGGGVAGLTALWQLTKRGIQDVLLVSGPERHGNAAAGRDGELVFPTGAHYLPLPSMQSRHMREMLAEFGVIRSNPYGERPTYDERYVVHGPSERVFYRGAWQEGYLPTEDVSTAERAEHERFFALVKEYSNARGSDGRRAFAVPLEFSSADERFLALDRVSFSVWLDGKGFIAPTLRWYLNYCCRDDYGRNHDEISAWAGLHYFCSRDGQASNAEQGAVLTWPQGLAALAGQLEGAQGAHQPWPGASVASLRATDGGVEAIVVVPNQGAWRSIRVKARRAIAAMPLFVLQHVLVDSAAYGFVGSRDVPVYAPWLVSNFLLHAFPEERRGAALSWDNVAYQESGLGYVVSTHQDIRMSRPERTAFTAYYALSEMTPDAGRHWLGRASPAQLSRLVGKDLRLAYGWKLPLCVDRVAITVRGHAMAVPQPGFLSAPGRLALRDAHGPILFAHSDLSGMSLFEEASWWGYRAAMSIVPEPRR